MLQSEELTTTCVVKSTLPHVKLLEPVWRAMKSRCDSVSYKGYKNYGGRGITYDPRWKDFLVFYQDMIAGYEPGLQLDREDTNLNYCKENCRWVSQTINMWNRRPFTGGSSKYIGVSWNKGMNKWDASIRKDNRTIKLGYYPDEKQAALVYDSKCLELRGQEAKLNQNIFLEDFQQTA